jgi:hypothetical protein
MVCMLSANRKTRTWLIQVAYELNHPRFQGFKVLVGAANRARRDSVPEPVNKVHVEGTGVIHHVDLRDAQECTAL